MAKRIAIVEDDPDQRANYRDAITKKGYDVSDRTIRDDRAAVRKVLQGGLRTGDIALPGEAVVGTRAMGDAVIAALGTTQMLTASPRRE